jgi:uncharacterized protein YjdB
VNKKYFHLIVLATLLFHFMIAPLSSNTVLAATTEKISFTIKEKNLSINIGDKKKLTITTSKKVSPIKWTSSNASIANVDQKGGVLAKKPGKVTITASYAKLKLKATTVINVKSPVINVSKIIISDRDLKLRAGESVQVTATVSPPNATDKTLIWSSNNQKVAEVEQDGTIYAIDKGFAQIKVSSKNKKVSQIISVRVEAIPEEVEEPIVPATPATPIPTPTVPSIKEVIKSVSESVVYIEAYDRKGKAVSSGSGFITSNDGKIVTNYHVVTNEKNPIESVKIKLVDGSIYSTSYVIGFDKKNDLAILKVSEARSFKPTTMGDSSLVEVGDKIITIGSPLGLENTVSEGIVSNRERVIDGVPYIQISAPISHGSSGGALINEKGEVIGVTSAGIDDGQNLNFAIPINLVKSLNIGEPKTLLSIQEADRTLLSGKQEIFETEPNDSFETANMISHEEFTIFGSIYNQYDLDHYQFTITSPTDILILAGMESKYSYLTSELLVGIMNADKKFVLAGSEYYGDSGTLYQKVEGTLQPGTYYLVLFGDNRIAKSLWSLNPIYLVVGRFL